METTTITTHKFNQNGDEFKKSKKKLKVQSYLKKIGLPQKALLLLDNAPSHPGEHELKSSDGLITAMFMPPNVTPLIQPMDQNAIRITKLHYRSSLLAAVFADDCGLIESIKKISLRDAVIFLDGAWHKLSQETLAKCWKPILNFTNLIEDDEDNIPLSILKNQKEAEAKRLSQETVNILETLNPESEGLRYVSALDSHTFPDNEEPNILGHGVPAADFLAQNSSCCLKQSLPAIDCDDNDKYNKNKLLLNFEDAPNHLKFNPYIRRGYRTFLSTKLCLQSIFWWTNETINIWTHLCGCLLFIGLTICDFQFLKAHADLEDQILVVCLLICFCLCMLLSSIYHIFSCKSEEHYELFLSVDYLGISLSLLAIYISSMYYAFWCFNLLRIVYSVIALCMFGLAVVVQIPKLNVSLNGKMAVLLAWAAYGVIPLAHWTVKMDGFENPLVRLMIPRVMIMYALCAIAFVIYVAKIPERWLTGKVDYFGHSHNWWHLFILAAFYHWHNTGIVYAEYRLNSDINSSLLT